MSKTFSRWFASAAFAAASVGAASAALAGNIPPQFVPPSYKVPDRNALPPPPPPPPTPQARPEVTMRQVPGGVAPALSLPQRNGGNVTGYGPTVHPTEGVKPGGGVEVTIPIGK